MAGLGSTLHTQHCNTDISPQLLSDTEITQYLEQIPQWEISADKKSIARIYTFKAYFETLAFSNAAAWVAQQQNHHPEITFSYNKCSVLYSTHSAGGLTLFDFICAARTDQLYFPTSNK